MWRWSSTPHLDPWLSKVAGTVPRLSLVIFDIKTPEGPLDNLYDRARTNLPGINLLFSIADYAKRDEFRKIKDRINRDPRAGVAFDENADPADVRDFFESNGYFHFWYGDGVNATGLGRAASSIEWNVDTALEERAYL